MKTGRSQLTLGPFGNQITQSEHLRPGLGFSLVLRSLHSVSLTRPVCALPLPADAVSAPLVLPLAGLQQQALVRLLLVGEPEAAGVGAALIQAGHVVVGVGLGQKDALAAGVQPALKVYRGFFSWRVVVQCKYHLRNSRSQSSIRCKNPAARKRKHVHFPFKLKAHVVQLLTALRSSQFANSTHSSLPAPQWVKYSQSPDSQPRQRS